MRHLRSSLVKTFVVTLAVLIQTIAPCQAQRAQKKIALIISIATYDQQKTGWLPLSSNRDAELMKAAMLKVGVREADIFTVADDKATREGILGAMKQIESNAKPGDHVIIHYSGHGQQIHDDNNDELDGLDEAIVPYGAFLKSSMYEKAALKFASLHLRDDDFGKALTSIRKKIGAAGHVLVIMDSCHSGTATRGVVKQRGTEELLLPDREKRLLGAVERAESSFDIAGDKLSGSRSLGKLIVISGAGAGQPNFETTDDEGKSVGSLSYCFTKAFAHLSQNMTYRSLFAQIQAEMALKARNQKPHIEGDIDYKIFDGAYIRQEPYFNITGKNGSFLQIDGGKLTGLFEGTTIYLQKAGSTSRSSAPIAKGKVTHATNFDAVIALEDVLLPSDNLKDYWAFPVDFTFGNKVFSVSLDRVADPDAKKALTAALSNLKLVRVTNTNPELIVEVSKNKGSLSLEILNAQGYSIEFRNDEGHLAKVSYHSQVPALVSTCVPLIRNYAQAAFLQEVDVKDQDHAVEVSFVPRRSLAARDTLPANIFMNAGTLELPEGQHVFLKVKNHGSKRTFFNIIGISPNGEIYAIYPAPESNANPQDCFLLPGQTAILWDYEVTIEPPYGNEICKVIASDKPVNISQIIHLRQHVQSKGTENSVSELIGAVFDNVTPRDVTHSGAARISTFELVYRITAAK